ncbi:hypothetical protein DCC62_17175 [candidate division KSB1 bacterium]|nr:MAG: hypothetical protein DCC62_17175 [candidate division KSB1 bacterium]
MKDSRWFVSFPPFLRQKLRFCRQVFVLLKKSLKSVWISVNPRRKAIRRFSDKLKIEAPRAALWILPTKVELPQKSKSLFVGISFPWAKHFQNFILTLKS